MLKNFVTSSYFAEQHLHVVILVEHIIWDKTTHYQLQRVAESRTSGQDKIQRTHLQRMSYIC